MEPTEERGLKRLVPAHCAHVLPSETDVRELGCVAQEDLRDFRGLPRTINQFPKTFPVQHGKQAAVIDVRMCEDHQLGLPPVQ